METYTNSIKSNGELRQNARRQLKGNWGTPILICLISGIIAGISGYSGYVGPIISFLIGGPLTLGITGYFLKLIRNEPARIENIFDGFKNFVNAFLVMLIQAIFIILWSLLLIIPGIIAAYRYYLAFYVLYDNPQMAPMEALNTSKRMMNGFKWKLFCLHLSFIGWGLLCVLTAGIGFLWLVPYTKTAEANFYQNLKEAQNF